MKTVDIRDVGNCAIKLFQSADNDQLRPLLHEIFDLPPPEKQESKPSPSTSSSGEPDQGVKVKSEPEELASRSNHSQSSPSVSSATMSPPELGDSAKFDIKRSASTDSYNSSCPSTPRTPNTPQRMPPLEYIDSAPCVSLPQVSRSGVRGHPGVVSGSNVTSTQPDRDSHHRNYRDSYPDPIHDPYPDSLDSRRASVDSLDWHPSTSTRSSVSGGAYYVSGGIRNPQVVSRSSSRGSSPRGMSSNSQSSNYSPPDGDLITSHSQQLHLDRTPSGSQFSPNTHPVKYVRSLSVDHTLSQESAMNLKFSGHAGLYAPDLSQPPVKTSRSEDSTGLQTFSEVSPLSGPSIYGDPHLMHPSHPPKNRIPHNSNDSSYNNVAFDFRVHKRGNIS